MVLGTDIVKEENFSENIVVTSDRGSLLEEPKDIGSPEWKSSVRALLF